MVQTMRVQASSFPYGPKAFTDPTHYVDYIWLSTLLAILIIFDQHVWFILIHFHGSKDHGWTTTGKVEVWRTNSQMDGLRLQQQFTKSLIGLKAWGPTWTHYVLQHTPTTIQIGYFLYSFIIGFIGFIPLLNSLDHPPKFRGMGTTQMLRVPVVTGSQELFTREFNEFCVMHKVITCNCCMYAHIVYPYLLCIYLWYCLHIRFHLHHSDSENRLTWMLEQRWWLYSLKWT